MQLLLTIDPIAVRIGVLSIRWYAICILSGAGLAVWLAMKEAKRQAIDPDLIIDFVLLAFPLAIIGARAYYVLFEWHYYQSHLDQIIAIWQGGLAIYGGLLTGLLVLVLFARHKGLSIIQFLDVIAPSILIAQAIGRWGNFINQEAYGRSVSHLNLPDFIADQMWIDGSYRIPTFLYESLWNLLGFIMILTLRRVPKLLKSGEVIAFYLIWYGLGRCVIEGMRTDSLMFMGFRVSQLLSIGLLLLGLAFIVIRRQQKTIPFYRR